MGRTQVGLPRRPRSGDRGRPRASPSRTDLRRASRNEMITTWSRGVADENMPEEVLVALADPIRRHPWWSARARLTLELLDRLGVRPPARVLDAGCGWGVTL